jgi:hypothetical protein
MIPIVKQAKQRNTKPATIITVDNNALAMK